MLTKGLSMHIVENYKNQNSSIQALLFLGVFAVFIGLRVIAWNNGPLLEDHDSVSLLRITKLFLALEYQKILEMSPDYTPFYPAFGAVFSALVGSVENGARLCSLLFSCVVFAAVIGIGRKIATPFEITMGLAVLAISPFLVRFSYSVLTEPSYVATIYIGFWFFWSKLQSPSWWGGLTLGIIFALGFLNRIEGILYLAAIPLLQLTHYKVTKKKYCTIRQLLVWVATFVISFSLLSAPHIWRVSEKMGSLSLNGRQTWSIMLNSNDNRSYEEVVLGLNYNPGQINLHYLQEHPEAREQLVSDVGIAQHALSYAKLIIHNLDDLHDSSLAKLIGPYGLFFFILGLLVIYYRKYYFEVFLITSFLCVGLTAPLLHDVAERHIAILAPIMILLQGVGIVALANQAVRFFEIRSLSSKGMAVLIFSALLVLSAKPLYRVLRIPDGSYSAYRASDLAEPIAIIGRISKEQLGRPANLIARKGYLALFSDSEGTTLPYTDYSGLVEYSRLNHADFLFLERRQLTDHPFLEDFGKGETPDFKLLYTGRDRWRSAVRLYRFNPQEFENK